jgi:hypothetical protein
VLDELKRVAEVLKEGDGTKQKDVCALKLLEAFLLCMQARDRACALA